MSLKKNITYVLLANYFTLIFLSRFTGREGAERVPAPFRFARCPRPGCVMPRSHILPPLRARGGAPPSCAHPSVRVRPFSGLRPALPRPTSPARPPTFARMRGHGAGGATPGRSPLGLHRPSFQVPPLRAPPPASPAPTAYAQRGVCGSRRGWVNRGAGVARPT